MSDESPRRARRIPEYDAPPRRVARSQSRSIRRRRDWTWPIAGGVIAIGVILALVAAVTLRPIRPASVPKTAVVPVNPWTDSQVQAPPEHPPTPTPKPTPNRPLDESAVAEILAAHRENPVAALDQYKNTRWEIVGDVAEYFSEMPDDPFNFTFGKRRESLAKTKALTVMMIVGNHRLVVCFETIDDVAKLRRGRQNNITGVLVGIESDQQILMFALCRFIAVRPAK